MLHKFYAPIDKESSDENLFLIVLTGGLVLTIDWIISQNNL